MAGGRLGLIVPPCNHHSWALDPHDAHTAQEFAHEFSCGTPPQHSGSWAQEPLRHAALAPLAPEASALSESGAEEPGAVAAGVNEFLLRLPLGTGRDAAEVEAAVAERLLAAELGRAQLKARLRKWCAARSRARCRGGGVAGGTLVGNATAEVAGPDPVAMPVTACAC